MKGSVVKVNEYDLAVIMRAGGWSDAITVSWLFAVFPLQRLEVIKVEV